MSISTEQLQAIIVPQATEVVLEQYEAEGFLAPLVANVQQLDAAKLYGHKITIMETAGELLEREDFQQVQADQPGEVGVAQARTRQFERSIQLSQRQAIAIMEAGAIPSWLSDQIDGLGRQAREAKNILLTRHYERGVIAAGDKDVFRRSYPGNPAQYEGKIYDGKAWFATDHPLRGSLSAISNLTQTAALTAATFEAARVKYVKDMAVDHRGTRINLRPDFIMGPPALEKTMHVIVNSVQEPGTDFNDVNFNLGRVRVIVNPYMTSSSGWFLGRSGFGLNFYDEGIPSVELREVPSTRSWNLSVETRFLIIPTDWRHAIANNFAPS